MLGSYQAIPDTRVVNPSFATRASARGELHWSYMLMSNFRCVQFKANVGQQAGHNRREKKETQNDTCCGITRLAEKCCSAVNTKI